MRKENRLQVFMFGTWCYVFCYDQWHRIVTTSDKRKALKGRDLEYFRKHFSSHEFRVI